MIRDLVFVEIDFHFPIAQYVGEAKDKFTYMIVSACPPGAKKQCTSSIYGEISVYDDEISCSDIADDDGDELDIAPMSIQFGIHRQHL